ncbi:MAG: hypothetical protein GC205_01825 [Bacteroidetes bacterium]|nr:hypothetical protein [Bacteroidota bacterium]
MFSRFTFRIALLTFVLAAFSSGAKAQVGCSSALAPVNLATDLSLSGAFLTWDSIPGSVACRLQVILPSGPTLTRNIFGSEPDGLFVPISFLSPGSYTWRVQCGCSTTSPFGLTPYSGTTSFSVGSTSVTDIDGNVYDIVQIGTQTWMAENLKTTRFSNGDLLPAALTAAEWAATTLPANAVYNEDVALEALYGKLYNWYAAADPRGLCPTGWHVPTDAEWTVLTDFLGGTAVSGGAMKLDSPLWYPPNFGATNSSGFTGLPGGFRNSSGAYFNINGSGYFWSSTEFSAANGRYRRLDFSGTGTTPDNLNKKSGFSVRCLQD